MDFDSSKIPPLTTPGSYRYWLLAIRDHIASNCWNTLTPMALELSPQLGQNPDPNIARPASPHDHLTASESKQRIKFKNYIEQLAVLPERLKIFDQYIEEERKVKALIRRSVPSYLLPVVPDSKKTPHPRDILIRLKEVNKENPMMMRWKVENEFSESTRLRWNQWPANGPDIWLNEWSELIDRCEEWAPDRAADWATCVLQVWRNHPDLSCMIEALRSEIMEGTPEFSSMEEVARKLRAAWNRRKSQTPKKSHKRKNRGRKRRNRK